MNISLTEAAVDKLRETGANSFRVVIKGYG